MASWLLNTRAVPALLVMQTTLGITLCNNLRDINLSIFESVPQVIFEVHSVHDLVLRQYYYSVVIIGRSVA